MNDLRTWLGALGLGEHADSFAAQGVDVDILADLTDDDLKQLGITGLGHRKRLLRAVADIGSRAAAEAAEREVPAELERRQLTVLICDLVDSSGLAARLDPEDLHAVMSQYDQCVVASIEASRGVVAERRGDSVLAYFGHPHAHEDDAVQATLAGLAVAESVARLVTAPAVALQARVGVATGTVIVGQPRGATIVGEAPNLAARLQALAQPSAVVVCGRTRALAGAQFEYLDMGEHQLKGWAHPVRAWHVVQDSSTHGHGDMVQQRPFNDLLVGRAEELELLHRRWAQAGAGEGRVVELLGEPGIGKSHLLRSFERTLTAAAHHTIRYACSEHHVNSTLHPVIARIERDAGFERGDSAAVRGAKLRSLFRAASADEVELVANLLQLSAGPASLADATPQHRKNKTFEVLRQHLLQAAARAPLLIIVEDAHWVDPTSLDLLTDMVEHVGRHRILLLVTARTEFAAPWPAHPHLTRLSLGRLHRQDAAALITQVAAGKTLPPDVCDDILARTDGVPLFVEELTKTVLDAGRLEELNDRYVGTLPAREIPTTLHASLAARLDRLGAAKEAAQVGAVVGRDFSYELLRAVLGWSSDRLGAAMQQLLRAQIVLQRGEGQEAVFTYRHALMRDAAVATLLKKRLAELHVAIADAMERLRDAASMQPAAVGNHLFEGGLPARAIPYWLEAGRDAARRSATVEAISHLRRGLEAIRQLPGDASAEAAELELLLALAPCLIVTQGPVSGDAIEAFTRARALCEKLGTDAYPQVMFWHATASVIRGELEQALNATLAVRRDAETRGDTAALINANRGQAMIMMFMGRIAEARAVMQRASDLFDAADEQERLAARAAGQDAGAAIAAQMAWLLWLSGETDEAVACIQKGLQRAEWTRHPHTEAYVRYYASVLHALRSEHALGQTHAERCLALSQQHGFRQWVPAATAMTAICSAALGGQPLGDVSRALSEYRAAGYQLGVTLLYVLFCRPLLARGGTELALQTIDDGLVVAERTGERFFEAELCRLRAACLVAADGTADAAAPATALLDRAMVVARAQGSRMQEGCAARDREALAGAGPAPALTAASGQAAA